MHSLTHTVRKIFLSLLLILSSGMLFAEDMDISKICTLLSSHGVTEGNFVQKKRAFNAKRALTSRGTFFLSHDRIYLQTKKPVETAMGVTETSIITITADGNRTYIDNSQNALFRGMAKIIVDMLNGDRTSLDQQFNYEITGTESEWNILLTPKDATFSSVIAGITLGGGSDLNHLEMKTTNGSSVSYDFSDLSYKEQLTDGQKKLFASK